MKENSKTIRAFFAIDVDSNIRRTAQDVKKSLGPHKNLRWCDLNNLHITLRFFDRLATKKIDGLLQTIASETEALDAFSIEADGLILFPPTSPKLLAMKIKLNDKLAVLVNMIEQTVAELGFTQEKKPYLPHITLARSRDGNLPDISNIIVEATPLKVDHVTLYRSEPNQDGSVYTALRQLGLRKV